MVVTTTPPRRSLARVPVIDRFAGPRSAVSVRLSHTDVGVWSWPVFHPRDPKTIFLLSFFIPMCCVCSVHFSLVFAFPAEGDSG